MDEDRTAPDFAAKDEPLRRDVGMLGALLGEVLVEQGGQALFDREETARLASRRRRAGDAGAEGELAAALTGLAPGDATEVVRAFSAYFAVVNMAERVHRIRRRRDYLQDAGGPQPGSLRAVLDGLAAAGVPVATVCAALEAMRIELVFTAHPTEAIRRSLLTKEQRIARALVDRIEQPAMTPPEDAANRARLRREITLLWQTPERPTLRPSVADEVEHVLFFVTDVLYRIVPPFFEAIADALRAAYGPGATDDLAGPVLRLGSWVGGDMDGNPNVGPDTIRATLARQRALVLELYQQELGQLASRLSQSPSRVPVDEAVTVRVAASSELMPEAAAAIPERWRDMPYRVLLLLMAARADAARRHAAAGYASPAELLADLDVIAASLKTNRGRHAGLFAVRRLARRVTTFGFHLATLDVRQDALVHRRAVGRLLGVPSLADLPAGERARLLRNALQAPLPDMRAATEDEETATALEVMRAIADGRASAGPDAIGPYVVSMAQGPDDALAVLLLARCAGLVSDEGHVPLDVAPLFETVDDLSSAGETLATLLGDDLYRGHVARRGDRQVVMIGYSDSGKDAGIVASRWALYRAQEALVAACDAAGVALTVFHGRGGTVSRGGSKPREAILAAPPGAVRGRLRVTEQGEIIHAKYGLRGIAERTLELTAGAVLEVTAGTPETPPRPDWAEAMAVAAEAGRRAFRALVYEDPDFLPYFRAATPIDVIERLRIASRPPSRRSGHGLADLRAIPWVFAWMQSRHLLPGWYGVGRGLQEAVRYGGEERLAAMAREWPIFSTLLADVEMVLAKADLAIAERYAALAGPAGKRIFPLIREEFERTRSLVLQLQGISELLDREPVLQRSIRLRNPYVDPMSLVQLDLLQRWRSGDRRDRELEDALVVTVRGIARGLQNTG